MHNARTGCVCTTLIIRWRPQHRWTNQLHDQQGGMSSAKNSLISFNHCAKDFFFRFTKSNMISLISRRAQILFMMRLNNQLLMCFCLHDHLPALWPLLASPSLLDVFVFIACMLAPVDLASKILIKICLNVLHNIWKNCVVDYIS